MSEHAGELLVADSFRVRVDTATGRAQARGLQNHLQRFRSTALEAWFGPEPEQRALEAIDAFIAESLDRIAAYGEGWPRLELWSGSAEQPQLRLSLRPLPALGDAIELRSIPAPNVAHPGRKGPNIARYRELSAGLGAEALLLDASGTILEGTTTSLLWWRDGTLHAAPDGGRVSSITEMLVTGIAQARGTELLRVAATPAALTGHEVWAVNALHGIRVVTSIDGMRSPAPDEDRLARFRAALDETWQSASHS